MFMPLLRVSPIVPSFLRQRGSTFCPFNYNNYSIKNERMVGITQYVDTQKDYDAMRVHSDGRYFGSWIATEQSMETVEMWERIYLDKYGVDFIFTNRPVPCTKARDMVQPIEPMIGGGKAKEAREEDELDDEFIE